MMLDSLRQQHGWKVFVFAAICVVGVTVAVADDGGPPASRVVGADLAPAPSGDGSGKVAGANVRCGTFENMGDYHFWYTGEITLFQCVAGEVRTSRGNANLYIYYGEPWSDALVPPNQAGSLVCSSTNGGTATDACNGCNYRCEYGVGGIWRSYAVPAVVPTDYCNEVFVYGCEVVELSDAGARRRGSEVEVTWEVTDEQATAGYQLYRRFAADEAWVLVNDTLVPVAKGGHYRVLDTVPVQAGDIFYKLEHVSLDGTSEHVIYISHEVPMNDSFPPRSE